MVPHVRRFTTSRKLIKCGTGFKLGVAQSMSVKIKRGVFLIPNTDTLPCQFHFVLYVFGIRKLNKDKIWTLLDIDIIFMKLMDQLNPVLTARLIIHPYNITALYLVSRDPFGHCLLRGAIAAALQEAIKCYINTIRSQSKLSGLYQ